MSILIDEHTTVVVQGATGKEGTRAVENMRSYGTAVIAGVTPGKGGLVSSGVPIFNTVEEAIHAAGKPTTSLITVPGKFVLDAAREAIEAKIPLINILSEGIPVADVAVLLALARNNEVRIVGPSSVGIISPGKSKLGSIGAGGMSERVFSPGHIGVISKSGGMTSEISRILSQAGIGQSSAIGIGGDPLIGTDFLDAALLFEQDPDTHAIVIFGELGGSYEDMLADAMQEKRITKPVVALIAGFFAETLPQGTVLGHAGAIVEHGNGSASRKSKHLRDAGAHLVNTPEEIVTTLTSII